MRIFEEKQAFRQWWLFLLLGSTVVVILVPLFNDVSQENIWAILISALLIVVVVIGFLVLRLYTRIDSSGIYAKFSPLNFVQKKFNWNEIEKCYVREYSPLSEYGGWGIRGFPKVRAYNVSGNMGIQLVTKDGRRFLLGTQKPKQAQQIMERYQDRNQPPRGKPTRYE